MSAVAVLLVAGAIGSGWSLGEGILKIINNGK